MSYSPITGSEEYRFYEIANKWLIFEPLSDEKYAVQYNLFSAKPGQQVYPNLNVVAPFLSSSNRIQIEKDVHIFDDQTEADTFITNLGEDNIHTIIVTTHEARRGSVEVAGVPGEHVTVGSTARRTEVHIINLPKFNISLDMIGMESEKGYFVRVYQSGSFTNGDNLKEISDEILTDLDGNLISDTYLKYFMISSDK